MKDETPIACTLGAGDYRTRMGWIAELNGKGLRRYERDDLILRLFYDPSCEGDVKELVAKERDCCAFLDFQLDRSDRNLVLSVRAPERARGAAEAVFAEFTNRAARSTRACGCC